MVNEHGIRTRSHVFQSLAQPRMVDGVHFSFFMLNTGVLFFILTAFKFFWWIPAYYLVHKGLGFFGKKDAIILPVYVRYTKQSLRYQAWPHPYQRLGFRPNGFGRGTWQ